MPESAAVIAVLGQCPDAGECSEAIIRMLSEQLFGVAGEVIACPAGHVEFSKQGQRLAAHRDLDQSGLAQLGSAEHQEQAVGLGTDPAFAVVALGDRVEPTACQLRCAGHSLRGHWLAQPVPPRRRAEPDLAGDCPDRA